MPEAKPIVAVTAISGAQQSAIAAAFDAAGWSVRPLSRSARATPFGEATVVDLATGAGLQDALAGATAVMFTVPQDHRDGVQVRAANAVAEAAERAGVARAVVNTAARCPDGAKGPVFEAMRGAISAFEERLLTVALMPPVFADNLLAPILAQSIAAGTLAYPVPAEEPVAWLSHRALGAFAVEAADAAPGRYEVSGPQDLTGPQLAHLLGARLGREVRFETLPVEVLAQGLDAVYGAPAGERVGSTYRYAAAHPGTLARGAAEAPFQPAHLETMDAFIARSQFRAAA